MRLQKHNGEGEELNKLSFGPLPIKNAFNRLIPKFDNHRPLL